MKYKDNWNETRERFNAWWDRGSLGRPMMRVVSRREKPLDDLESETPFETPEACHLDVDERSRRFRNYCRTHRFLAEAYPSLDLNIGPGSLAVYLGSEPEFAWDTVWYTPCVADWESYRPLRYNPGNRWWIRHLALIRRAVALSGGEYPVSIPDLIENVDILAAMRGPQAFCCDLMDDPDRMEDRVEQLDRLYFSYYDAMYEAVRAPDGSSTYTAFHIWGPGRTGKVQCDFSALMSPSQFRRFVLPSLKKQCRALDRSLYHLDGPDAVRHLPAILEIEDLDALQWVPGYALPDSASQRWYPIYDAVRAAEKSLFISVYDGNAEDWIRSARRLLDRYGPGGMYLLFPEMSERDAEKVIKSF